MDELAHHRGTAYIKGSGYGALGDALLVQLHHFEIASVAFLTPCLLLSLIPGGESIASENLRSTTGRSATSGRRFSLLGVRALVIPIHEAFDRLG
jgi:hypothetical protein